MLWDALLQIGFAVFFVVGAIGGMLWDFRTERRPS
jgi:hypothetical protein